MAFNFTWPEFSPGFLADARQMLDNALNKGNTPPIIADRIQVEELNMGTIPPELEILEIGELSTDRFRGIFRLNYAGDAHIVVKTKVQANPLTHKRASPGLLGGRSILAAHQPLVVPMHLRLSALRLRAIVVLVVSKQKGITLVFKNDPLENLDVSSTFDSIAVIQKFIQQEIEGQLREMFREDLPGIIHRLSQRWLSGKVEAAGNGAVETKTPYRDPPPTPASELNAYETMSAMPDLESYDPLYGLQRPAPRAIASPHHLHPRLRTVSSSRSLGRSPQGVAAPQSVYSTSPSHSSAFPDIEHYDPTYGLRPETIPTYSGFSGFGRLWESSRGLAELSRMAEEESTSGANALHDEDDIDLDDEDREFLAHGDEDEFTTGQLDESFGSGLSFNGAPPRPPSESPSMLDYETIPAVGGGTVTRPRIWHSQSLIRPPSGSGSNPAISSATSVAPTLDSGRTATPTLLSAASTLRQMSRAQSVPAVQRAYLSMSRSSSVAPTPTFSRMPISHSNPVFGLPSQHVLSPPSEYPFPNMPTPAGSRGSPPPPRTRSRTQESIPTSSSTRSQSRANSLATTRSGGGGGFDSSTAPTSVSGHSPTRGKPFPSTSHPPYSVSPRSSSSPPRARTLSAHHPSAAAGPITLTAHLNDNVSQLATLSHSNHTLSPFTRSVEHFTVRSFPHVVMHRAGTGMTSHTAASTPGTGERKAVRKRTYRVGGGGKGKGKGDAAPGAVESAPATLPATPMSSPELDQPASMQRTLLRAPFQRTRRWAREASMLARPVA